MLLANLFAAHFRPAQEPSARLWFSLRAVSDELLYAMNYLGLALALVGFYLRRGKLLLGAGAWLRVLLRLAHGVLVLLAMSVHYISDRHVCPWCCCSVTRRRSACTGSCTALCGCGRGRWATHWDPAAGVLVLMGLTAAACLPRTLERLHGNRAGNHAAGLWLASRLRPGDMVDDDHAGRTTTPDRCSWSTGTRPRRRLSAKSYVVMMRSRDPEVAAQRQRMERKLAKRGALVYHWPEEKPATQARVVVYAVPRIRAAIRGRSPRRRSRFNRIINVVFRNPLGGTL